jgi:hypothetical protein
MKQITILLLILLPKLGLSQYDYDSHKRSLLINNHTQGRFVVYDTTNYKINMVKSESEVDWTDIGNVVMSKIYANTPEWSLKVYEDTAGVVEDEKHYEGIKNINTIYEFIRPICTYYYTVEGEEAAVMSFTWHTKENEGEIPLNLTVVKKNGRWYDSNRLAIFGVTETVNAFREQVLSHIFAGKETNNQRLNKLMHKVRINGEVDFEKLFDQLVEMKSNPDKSDYHYYTYASNASDFPEFKPMQNETFTSKVVQPMDIPKCRNYRYKEYEYYVAGPPQKVWVSELAIIKNHKKETPDTLQFLFRYTFMWDGHPVSAIKYDVGSKSKANIIEYIDGKWIVTDNPRFENLRYFMQCVKNNYINEIGTMVEMQKDPILKKYTPLYKRKMHNLNVDNLGAFLKTKPKELEPYCDFD